MADYTLLTPCSEILGQVNETFNVETGMACSVTLHCAWSARHALVAEILGTPYPNSSFANPPQAVSAAIKPMQGNAAGTFGQNNLYDLAEVTISYSNKIQDFISESLEPTAEFLTSDYRRFRWGSNSGDPLTEGEAPGKLFKSLNIVRTLYQVSSTPVNVLTAIGCCNLSGRTSALLGLTFAAETLLYQPPHLTRVIKTDGSIGRTVVLKFSYKPQGWNVYWRAKTQSYAKIYLAGGAEYKCYTPVNLGSLLF